VWRNEKKGNVIKLQKDGRGNKVANSHYQRKHTLRAPSKKRASTFRHKYKILDALKLTWQIGIPAQGGTVKRSHKLLLASPSSKDFSGLKRRSTQEINSSAALRSTHRKTDRQTRKEQNNSQFVTRRWVSLLDEIGRKKWGVPTQHISPSSLYLLTNGTYTKY
jgi:hypothetical protein